MMRTLWYVKPGLVVVHAADPVVREAGASTQVVHAADTVVLEVGASSTCCGPCGSGGQG
jgi:hypothetical protein